MINSNNIVANYQIFNPYKNKAGQVAFRASAGSGPEGGDLIINGVLIPDNTLLKDIRPVRPLPLREGLIVLSSLKNDSNCKFVVYDMRRLGNMAAFSEEIDQISYLKDRNLVKIIDSGGNTVAIDIGCKQSTGEKEVLKLSRSPNYPEACGRKLDPSFDIPVFCQDRINGLYYCVQAFGTEEGLTPEMVKLVKQNIKSAGYRPTSDFKREQVRMYNGKPYLIDPDCAVAVQN